MPGPDQRLSPAELAALEHAFAVAPASEAYRKLAEAYLGMGRFMEAMVVARRGIKNHPEDPTPRLLLARVYAAQKKDDKAVEELGEVLRLAPAQLDALRLLAAVELQRGRRDPGADALRKAREAAPADPEVAALAAKYGIKFEGPRPATVTSLPRPAAAQPSPGATPAGHGEGAPAEVPAPSSAPRVEWAREEPEKTDEYAPRRRKRRVGLTIGLVAALAAALAGWGINSARNKARAVEIDKLLRQARELVDKDAFGAYRDAARLCERILERDRDSIGGHAYLAYIDAIRWGELGEGDAVRAEAQRHLDAVKKLHHPHSHAYAAEAYLRQWSGDPRGAIAALQEVLKGPEGASPLLHGVLGVIQMQAGDLDGARESLTYARQHAPGDIRALQMLAEQWRRRGHGFEGQASALYDAILTRLAPDHVPSLLGKAQLLLDEGHSAEALKRIGRVLEPGQNAAPRQIAIAHALRGSILHAQGKPSEGDGEEQQALALEPGNPDVHDLIGRRKLRGGDAGGAVASFQRALQLDPNRVAFYVDLANALLRTPGGAKDAVAALERAAANVENARVTKTLGDAYRSAGDLDRARSSYERALAMEKKYPEALLALAIVDRERKDDARALEELNRAVQEFGEGSPGAASAWVEIARLQEERHAAPATISRAYAAALKVDPQSCPALFGLGRSRADRHGGEYDPGSAAQLLNEYLRLCPQGPHAADAQRLLTPERPKPKRPRYRW